MSEYSNDEDVKWMLEAQKGDQIAFRKIVEKYQSSLLNFFYYMNASRSESEDLAQESLLKLYLYREKYTPTAKLSTFLFRIARNTAIDYIRKKKAVSMSFEGDLLESPDNKEYRTAEKDWQGSLEIALKKLPEKLRSVVVMSYFEGLKQQEIADILEVPLGTVKSRMSFAMKQLKDLMENNNAK